MDTNVLIAASAANPTHPNDIDATPEDPALRLRVWEWLDQFNASATRLILDTDGKIYDEYCKKLGFNDYGIQVVMNKWSTSAVDNVVVAYDKHNEGVLPDTLAAVVHDGEDKKMVAAALASYVIFGEGCVAFAGDTDWHDWEDALARHSVILEPIIETWSREKHAAKKLR